MPKFWNAKFALFKIVCKTERCNGFIWPPSIQTKKNRGETPNEKNNQQMRPRTQYAPLEKQKLIPDKPSYSIGASAHADTCDFDHFFR